ncbi:MAG: hypothetical protein ACKV2U_31820 [Bryobacteraceae bacterium]
MWPSLSEQPSRFSVLEREVQQEFRSRMLARLQEKVNAVAEEARPTPPLCPQCARPMGYHDTRPISWLARCGRLQAVASRYRCAACRQDSRPLLDLLGVEPGRISGSLARLLALLATVAPYKQAGRLASLLLGVDTGTMGIWRVAQRLGQAAASYSDALNQYHADSHGQGAAVKNAPPAVVLGVDGCVLRIQVRPRRRRRVGEQAPPVLPPVEKGQFREVKTGVLLLPQERVYHWDGGRWCGDSWSPAWGRRRDFPASVWTTLGVGLGGGGHGGGDRGRWRGMDLEPRRHVRAALRNPGFLPQRALSRLAELEVSIRKNLNPVEAYNMVPGH